MAFILDTSFAVREVASSVNSTVNQFPLFTNLFSKVYDTSSQGIALLNSDVRKRTGQLSSRCNEGIPAKGGEHDLTSIPYLYQRYTNEISHCDVDKLALTANGYDQNVGWQKASSYKINAQVRTVYATIEQICGMLIDSGKIEDVSSDQVTLGLLDYERDADNTLANVDWTGSAGGRLDVINALKEVLRDKSFAATDFIMSSTVWSLFTSDDAVLAYLDNKGVQVFDKPVQIIGSPASLMYPVATASGMTFWVFDEKVFDADDVGVNVLDGNTVYALDAYAAGCGRGYSPIQQANLGFPQVPILSDFLGVGDGEITPTGTVSVQTESGATPVLGNVNAIAKVNVANGVADKSFLRTKIAKAKAADRAKAAVKTAGKTETESKSK